MELNDPSGTLPQLKGAGHSTERNNISIDMLHERVHLQTSRKLEVNTLTMLTLEQLARQLNNKDMTQGNREARPEICLHFSVFNPRIKRIVGKMLMQLTTREETHEHADVAHIQRRTHTV